MPSQIPESVVEFGLWHLNEMLKLSSSSNPRRIHSIHSSIRILLRKRSRCRERPDCQDKRLISVFSASMEESVRRIGVQFQGERQGMDLPSFKAASATTFLLLHNDGLGLLLAVLHLAGGESVSIWLRAVTD